MKLARGFFAERRRERNEQAIFSWTKVARKTLNAAVCLWIFLPISRLLFSESDWSRFCMASR
ncbi:Uncharacterized protein HZ326_29932, partial [Fusarium oxysporum f. sp. albedinis]